MNPIPNNPQEFLEYLTKLDHEINNITANALHDLKEQVWDEEVAIEEATSGIRTLIKQGGKAVGVLSSLLE